jgi:hypothetical protein
MKEILNVKDFHHVEMLAISDFALISMTAFIPAKLDGTLLSVRFLAETASTSNLSNRYWKILKSCTTIV